VRDVNRILSFLAVLPWVFPELAAHGLAQALLCVAHARVDQIRAGDAASVGVLADRSSADLITTTAGRRAIAPIIPRLDLAVGWTVGGVAITNLIEPKVIALETMPGVVDLRPGAALAASTAGERAFTPAIPGSHRAIHRLGVASGSTRLVFGPVRALKGELFGCGDGGRARSALGIASWERLVST